MLFSLLLFSCTSDDGKDSATDSSDNAPSYDGIAALGYESNDNENVTLTEVANSDSGLNVPRDLAFNPQRSGELWVTNRADDSVTLLHNAGTANQSAEHLKDPAANHFMEEVSSIAFGEGDTFATCQESRNTYDNQYQGNDFMGPTLWSSDRDIFAKSNPEAVDYLSEMFSDWYGYDIFVDLGSHLDMNHETPLCMGIAWETKYVYWVFDGANGSIDRYDFGDDHGPGYDDHSDGIIGTYAEGEFQRVEGVPSHMFLDRSSGLLYIVDTGNNAIKTLDILSGERGNDLPKMEPPGTTHYEMNNVAVNTLINGADVGLERPSGISIIDDTIFVTDNANGKIMAFSMDGQYVDSLQTNLGDGALMGIYAAAIDDLWFTDAVNNKVWRLQPADSDANASAIAGEYTAAIIIDDFDESTGLETPIPEEELKMTGCNCCQLRDDSSGPQLPGFISPKILE